MLFFATLPNVAVSATQSTSMEIGKDKKAKKSKKTKTKRTKVKTYRSGPTFPIQG